MNGSSTLAPPDYPGKPGLWQWLLRSTGLETWFRQAPAAAHAGQEKRILLLIALSAPARPVASKLLTEVAHACADLIKRSGGELLDYRPGMLLLAWPASAEQSVASVAALYCQLRASVYRLGGSPTLSVSGAAGLGWATPGPALAAPCYDLGSLRALAGILHESQRLGGELLLTAALHQQLAAAPASPCLLHVAFEVPGHRYPATLYRVATPASI